MAADTPAAFFSYSREDKAFAQQLAADLKAAGANVWMDELDIEPGTRWDRSVRDALACCPRMLVVLSPASVDSENVLDEIDYALEKHKTIIPVLHQDCETPLRLRRVQYVDLRTEYERGLKALLKVLGVQQPVAASAAAAPAPTEGTHPAAPDSGVRRLVAEQVELEIQRRLAAERECQEEERNRAAEQARLEEEHKQAAKRARLDEERKHAAEQARLEEAWKKIEQARLEEEKKRAAEKARLEEAERERHAAAEKARREQEERDREAAERARREQEEHDRQPAAEKARLEQEERNRQAAAEKARLEQQERERLAALAAAEKARLEQEERDRIKATEEAFREQEERDRQAAEQARLEQQRKVAAEQERLEEERTKAAEQVRMGVPAAQPATPVKVAPEAAAQRAEGETASIRATPTPPIPKPAAKRSSGERPEFAFPPSLRRIFLLYRPASDLFSEVELVVASLRRIFLLYRPASPRARKFQLLFYGFVFVVFPWLIRRGFFALLPLGLLIAWALRRAALNASQVGLEEERKQAAAPSQPQVEPRRAAERERLEGKSKRPSESVLGSVRGWLARDRKLVLVVLAVAGLFIAGWTVGFVFELWSGFAVSKVALAQAQLNPAFVQRLGEPVKYGWFPGGRASIANSLGSLGSANVAISVSGPKAKGTLYVSGSQTPAGTWTFSRLELKVQGQNERINLLREVPAMTQWAWAVGEKGMILHTEDGGHTWQQQSSGIDPGLFVGLFSVTFVTPQSGWAVGGAYNSQVILHTEDGGHSWRKQRGDTNSQLHSVTFPWPEFGCAVGETGFIMHTGNGGFSWKRQTSGTEYALFSVALHPGSSGWAVGAGGTILHTKSAGGTGNWQSQVSGTNKSLYSVISGYSDSGWVVGEAGTILHTEDGGDTWQKQISGTDYGLSSVAFATPTSGWAVGGKEGKGIILHTEDGGHSWQQQNYSGPDLTSVTFITAQSGWAVGSKGTIVHTEDAGRTWQQQSSGIDSQLISITFVRSE